MYREIRSYANSIWDDNNNNNNMLSSLELSFVDVPLIFSCPADHVPDWQPRILLGTVEARAHTVTFSTLCGMLRRCSLDAFIFFFKILLCLKYC